MLQTPLVTFQDSEKWFYLKQFLFFFVKGFTPASLSFKPSGEVWFVASKIFA